MKLSYRIVNVFTRDGDRRTGNPLCVFEDGTGLRDDEMQALALQFNLSETSFVLKSESAHARVRIFAPTYEMPFAGHPTLGTACVVRDLRGLANDVVLELNVGPIAVSVQNRLYELKARPARTRRPAATKAQFAEALGLSPEDVGDPLWVDNGMEQTIVPLASVDAVRKANPDYGKLGAATNDGGRPQSYVFAEGGDDTLVARYFFSKGESLIEDPATGSATANLGGWYLAQKAPLPLTRTIAQGDQALRPSTLRLRIDADRNVFVAGEAIEVGRGTLDW